MSERACARSWALAGRFGYAPGTFGDGETIPNRSMNSVPMAVFGGYRFTNLQVGLSLEFAQNSQAADPATVQNQNADGTSLAGVVELQWMRAKWGFTAGYRGLSTYTFSNTGISGQSVRYSGSGYSFGVMRSIRNKVGVYVDATFDTFDKSDAQKLEPNVRQSRYGAGVIFSNFWK